MHMCLPYRLRQQGSEGLGAGWSPGRGHWGREKGDICNSLNNKNF